MHVLRSYTLAVLIAAAVIGSWFYTVCFLHLAVHWLFDSAN